jgi:hypothetical protein
MVVTAGSTPVGSALCRARQGLVRQGRARRGSARARHGRDHKTRGRCTTHRPRPDHRKGRFLVTIRKRTRGRHRASVLGVNGIPVRTLICRALWAKAVHSPWV